MSDDSPEAPRADLLRDDPAVREAFRQGERRAMAMVYDAYLPLVNTICRHGFGTFRGFFSPSDRDDAVQGIFAAAFEERTRLAYNGLDAYGSFLRGVARNVIRKMLESQTRFQRQDAPPPQEEEALEDRVIGEETAQLIRQWRQEITDPPQPEVLQRYFVEGWAEEKLAAHLQITRHQVRKTIALLQRRLERMLKSHGITDNA